MVGVWHIPWVTGGHWMSQLLTSSSAGRAGQDWFPTCGVYSSGFWHQEPSPLFQEAFFIREDWTYTYIELEWATFIWKRNWKSLWKMSTTALQIVNKKRCSWIRGICCNALSVPRVVTYWLRRRHQPFTSGHLILKHTGRVNENMYIFISQFTNYCFSSQDQTYVRSQVPCCALFTWLMSWHIPWVTEGLWTSQLLTSSSAGRAGQDFPYVWRLQQRILTPGTIPIISRGVLHPRRLRHIAYTLNLNGRLSSERGIGNHFERCRPPRYREYIVLNKKLFMNSRDMLQYRPFCASGIG
jgi:hypothetical protein